MQGDDIELIDAKLREEKDPKVRHRLRMILLLKEGYKQTEVAEIMRTTKRTVYAWKKRYEEGFEGLKTRKKTGRKRKTVIQKSPFIPHHELEWSSRRTILFSCIFCAI